MTAIEQVERIEQAAHAAKDGKTRKRCLDVLTRFYSYSRLCNAATGKRQRVYEFDLSQAEADAANLIVDLRDEYSTK